jgi:hypothetical protein
VGPMLFGRIHLKINIMKLVFGKLYATVKSSVC